jgi:hypothetical protein
MYKKNYNRVLQCLMKHRGHNTSQTIERNVTEFRGDLGSKEKIAISTENSYILSHKTENN